MQNENKWMRMSQAAKIAHVSPQALFMAMKKGKLKCKREKFWMVSLQDLNEYRANKYSRSKRNFQGTRVHDLDTGRWSVLYAAKTLSSMLEKPVTQNRLYLLIRTNRLPATKFGGNWVLKKEDIEELYRTLKREEEYER